MSRTAFDLDDDFGAEDRAILDSIFGDEDTWERAHLYDLDDEFDDDDDDMIDVAYEGLSSYDLFGPDE